MYRETSMLEFSKIESRVTPCVIAHRGASKVHHENTLEAFEEAIRMGADAVEFDVRRTKDGVLVVHHNVLGPRSRRRVNNLTYEQLSAEYNARKIHLCTLDEALRLCEGRISLDVELKEGGYQEEVLSQVERYYDLNHVAFTSFQDETISELRRLRPNAITGLLIGLHIPARLLTKSHHLLSLKRVRQSGADFVAPNWKLARLGLVKRMREAGYPSVVWTVDNITTVRKLAEFGVAGIITNRPHRTLAAINT